MTQSPPPSGCQRASASMPDGGLLGLSSSDPRPWGRGIMRGTCAACGVVSPGLHAGTLPAQRDLRPTGGCADLGLAAVSRAADGAR
jgi:hypothetical protein